MTSSAIEALQRRVGAKKAPVAAESRGPGGTNVLAVINTIMIAAVAIFVVFSGIRPADDRNPPGPGPLPVIDEQVVESVDAALKKYAKNLVVAQDRLIEKIEAKEINSSRQYASDSASYTKQARDNAFLPLNQLNNDHLPAGTWPEERSAILSFELSKRAGYERASK